MNISLIPRLETPAETLVIPITIEHAQETLAEVAEAFWNVPPDLSQDFKAKEGEELSFYPFNDQLARRVVLLGLGKNFKSHKLKPLFRKFIFDHKDKLRSITLDLSEWTSLRHMGIEAEAQNAAYVTSGAALGLYELGLLKSDIEATHQSILEFLDLLVTESEEDVIMAAVNRAGILTQAQVHAMNLVNLPGNRMSAQDLAKWAVTMGENYQFSVEVMDKAEIEATGLHGLLAVNQGSTRPPAFIIMEYKPDHVEGKLPKVALIGKGVTFDAGGISLKGRENMHYMKSDMGGAAAVIGTMEAATRLQLPVHLIGIVPTTDNMPDGGAVAPGDIIDTYSGLTIEVMDTDAEGRMILADGLAYAHRQFQPDVMIDLATLTGAVVMSLGYHAAGLFTANDDLAEALTSAGQASHERVWRMPIWEEYDRQMDSDVADVKNYGGRAAGAITAAKFLERFTEQHPAWAHLDIAGMAFGDSPFAKMKSGTGYGIHLLITYLSNLK